MWMDEAEPDWGAPDPEPTPEEKAAKEAAEKAAGGEGGAAPADGAPADGEAPAEDPDAVDPLKFNRHWVRPRFLQYSYLYDYRRNYYDDVLDYLDRRSHGVFRDIPRAQTWAERVLRTYNQKNGTTATAIKVRGDEQLINRLHHTAAIQHYHAKSYYHKVFTQGLVY